MKLAEIYEKIVSLSDYTPSPVVNSLFSALVEKATDSFTTEMLSKKKCRCLQKICSHAEAELEKYWAQKIIDGEASLVDFPYYKNYQGLTRLEWNALASCANHTRHNVLFVGSGPFPLTAIILANQYRVSLTLIDRDVEAVKQSKALIRALGLQQMIHVVYADGATFDRYQDFNVIFVAALAGITLKQKEKLFRCISARCVSCSHVIARSSRGKRRLLYPSLPQSVYRLFHPILEISPYHEVVNSIVVLRK